MFKRLFINFDFFNSLLKILKKDKDIQDKFKELAMSLPEQVSHLDNQQK